MSTVQQPRRGATRRVLKAAGLALGAVLVSSQAQGAYAADGAATALSTCPGAFDEVNSELNGGLCGCKLGYSDNQGAGASSPAASATPFDCRYCAPGYYLKTASLGDGSVCGEIDQTKLHSTTVNTVPPADVKTSALAQAPTSAQDGDFCAAGHYGTATSFDGTGCTACPFGGSSDAGSSAVTGCTPDCSSLTVAKDSDGTTPLSAGDGIQLVTSPSTGKLDDCETAPGYYLIWRATDANTAGGLEIHKAPANLYAPGQQNVVNGDNYPQMASANMDTSENPLVSACPFGGVSEAASSAVTDCDPDCSETNADSGAVADGFGTCQCAANYYGSPEDATGGTLAVASAGCTACPAGGTSTAGTASSSGCTAPPPTTADSAGATTPIAVALATAAAVPLLL
jgi:hypothetical protein